MNKFRWDLIDLKTNIISIGELYKETYLSTEVNENKKKNWNFLKSIIIFALKGEDIKIYAEISVDIRKKEEIIGDGLNCL